MNTTLRLNPDVDSYISIDDAPTTNFGSQSFLYVQANDDPVTTRTILRFPNPFHRTHVDIESVYLNLKQHNTSVPHAAFTLSCWCVESDPSNNMALIYSRINESQMTASIPRTGGSWDEEIAQITGGTTHPGLFLSTESPTPTNFTVNNTLGVNVDITRPVSLAVSRGFSHIVMMLTFADETSGVAYNTFFYSRESLNDPANRAGAEMPHLTVNYNVALNDNQFPINSDVGTPDSQATVIYSGLTSSVSQYQIKEVSSGTIFKVSTTGSRTYGNVLSVDGGRLVILLKPRTTYQYRVKYGGNTWTSWTTFKTRSFSYETPASITSHEVDISGSTVTVTNNAPDQVTLTRRGATVINTRQEFNGTVSNTPTSRGARIVNNG